MRPWQDVQRELEEAVQELGAALASARAVLNEAQAHGGPKDGAPVPSASSSPSPAVPEVVGAPPSVSFEQIANETGLTF